MTAPVDETAFQALRQHCDIEEIVEYTYLTAAWNLSNRFAEALHLVVEPPGRRIDFAED